MSAQPARTAAPRAVPTDPRRWLLIGLLFLAGLINYMDRAALSIAAPLITADLNLDPAQLGIVFSSFSVGYALFCLVGGWSADRFGPKHVLLVAMTVWSIFCGLTAAATSLAMLVLFRTLFGMGEGPFSAAVTKLVSAWFPPDEQATAIALAHVGTPLGAAVAGPAVGGVAVAFGWRAAFVAIAAMSLLWLVPWAIASGDRPQPTPPEPRQQGIPVARVAPARAPFRNAAAGLLRPPILAIAFAMFGYSYILCFALSWFPTYLATAHHLSIRDMSVLSAIPWTLGFVGLAGGGLASDALFRRSGDMASSRKVVVVAGLFVAAVSVALAGTATGAGLAVALMSVSAFAMYMTGSLYFTLVIDLSAPQHVGRATGVVHFLAACAGIVAPLATGFIVQASGRFTAAFVLAGAVALAGAAAVALGVRRAPARRPD